MRGRGYIMRKGEENFKAIEKIIMLLVILFALAIVNGKIYELIGTQMMPVLWCIIRRLTILGIFFLIVKQARVIHDCRYSKKSKQVWRDVKEGSRSKIMLHLKGNEKSIPMFVLMYLAEIYEDDDEFFRRALNEIVSLYGKGNIDEKSTISFFLLQHENNNEVARMFEKNADLKEQCVKLSQENIRSIKGEFNYLQKEGVTKSGLVIFFQKLLHICLPNNGISKEDIVDSLEYISGWTLKNVTKDNIDSYQEAMALFVLMIPALKHKLSKTNILSKIIAKNFKEIEKSEWLKCLLSWSYEHISYCLQSNGVFSVADAKLIPDVCMIYIYYERMNVWKKERFLRNIMAKHQQFHKEYDTKKSVLLVLMGSPLRRFQSDEDFAYNYISLVYLCVSQIMQQP